MAMAMKIVFMMIAITMALTVLVLTTTNLNLGKNEKHNSIFETTREGIISKEHVKDMTTNKEVIIVPKRVSRFLVEKINSNPRAADHCHKDNEIFYVFDQGQNSTCCNNKCMDLSTDSKNCGSCKNKCKFTESCCGGQCVNLAYDKRHCGVCNNKCMPGGYCPSDRGLSIYSYISSI